MKLFKRIKEPITELISNIKTMAADLKEIKQLLKHYGHAIEHNTHLSKEANLLSLLDTPHIQSSKYTSEKSLLRHQSQVFSQNGEDGIIAEIFNRIGTTDKVFVEIGLEDGTECNSRLLLQSGWTGLWIESDKECGETIQKKFSCELDNGQLRLRQNLVTKENIEPLLEREDIPPTFDFLSIDIDMNTHHVWSAIRSFKPRVACIEYNASVPPSLDYSVPYDENAKWDGSNHFGAGLKTLEKIGQELGYSLVACDFLGVNAFFVSNEACDELGEKFLAPFSAEFHYEPPRYSLTNHRGHPSKL